MKTYKLVIEIKVAESWIADGFNPETPEWKQSIQDAIEGTMPYAYGHEFKAEITSVVAPKFTIGELEELGLIP